MEVLTLPDISGQLTPDEIAEIFTAQCDDPDYQQDPIPRHLDVLQDAPASDEEEEECDGQCEGCTCGNARSSDDDEPNDSMDGDAESALASAGFGTDEDYGSCYDPDDQDY